MRPHLLELEAFGAFPGRVALDLDDLAQGGLLLLCGDTGGGKTTLLDALGFALYGVVPGERSKAKDSLRSHHAAPGVAAEVRLEFTARGRRLRVTRRPLQDRPKARGTGTVRENPTALLERRDGDAWVPVAQRPEDVGLEIGRLLGMDAGQFFQVVVLPQGRFAAFLQAEHKQREELLKKLFHVDRFEHAEAQLSERAAAAGRRLEAARTELAVVAARVEQEAGVESPDDLEAAPEWVLELATGAEDEAGRRAAAMERRGKARADAERALAGQQELARRQRARAETEQELADLEREQPAVDALARGALGRPSRAARATGRRRRTRGPPSSWPRPSGPRSRPVAGCPSTARPPTRRRPTCVRARRSCRSSPAGSTACARCSTGPRSPSARRRPRASRSPRCRRPRPAWRSSWRTSCPPRSRPRRSGSPQRAPQSARCPACVAPAASSWRPVSGLADELSRLDAARPASATAAARRRRPTSRQPVQRAKRLREQRFDAITAELASRLTDGDECPVCGSLEHPAVFEVQADHVSKEAEQAAETAAELARQAAAEAQQALQLHDQRRADLAERLGSSPADAVAAAALDGELSSAQREAARLAAAEAEVAAVRAAVTTATAELARREAELAGARRHELEQTALVTELRDRLQRELGDDLDLPRRQREVAALAAALEQAADAGAAAVAARTAAAEAARACARAGGRRRASARPTAPSGPVATPPGRTRAQDRLDRHTRALAAVRGRLASADLAVPLQPPASVAACEAQLVEAARVHEEAVAELRVASERAAALARLVPAWETASSALPAAARRRGPPQGAGRAGGRSRRQPPVHAAVDLRAGRPAGGGRRRPPACGWSAMSGGRYTLVHSDVGHDKRSACRPRPAGRGRLDRAAPRHRHAVRGETFMTALALALGLADVVTAESGGHSIDALFVDEGFGTLDAHSLDQVMDVLDDLRSGGRLVGIVSHVADLRQRIPAQVRVLKGEQGSSVVAGVA